MKNDLRERIIAACTIGDDHISHTGMWLLSLLNDAEKGKELNLSEEDRSIQFVCEIEKINKK